MHDLTRPLTWQERQRSIQARRKMAEALSRPIAETALGAAAAVQRVSPAVTAASTTSTRVGLAQTAGGVAGTSIARQRSLADALGPSITRIAGSSLVGVQVGSLLGVHESLVKSIGDIGRFGALGQFDSLAKTVNQAVGIGGLHKTVQAMSASVLTNFTRHVDLDRLFRPVMPNLQVLAGSVVRPVFEQVHDTLNLWSRSLGGFDQIGRYLARVPLIAALRARRAALRGHLTVVREFIVDWLEQRASEPMLEATIDALLEDDWVPVDDDLGDVEVIDHLRSRTTDRYTRRHKPIGSTQIVGRRVDSLDRLVPLGSSDERVPLVAVTADPSSRAGQDLAPAAEQRALRALAQFKPDEQKVLLSWEPGLTWPEAAAVAGLSPEVAGRVRRKRKRVVAEMSRRAAQRPA